MIWFQIIKKKKNCINISTSPEIVTLLDNILRPLKFINLTDGCKKEDQGGYNGKWVILLGRL